MTSIFECTLVAPTVSFSISWRQARSLQLTRRRWPTEEWGLFNPFVADSCLSCKKIIFWSGGIIQLILAADLFRFSPLFIVPPWGDGIPRWRNSRGYSYDVADTCKDVQTGSLCRCFSAILIESYVFSPEQISLPSLTYSQNKWYPHVTTQL